MKRDELLYSIENGSSNVMAFLCKSDISLRIPSSYDNWNDNDVGGHIIGWMNYSIDKLSSIKLGTKQSDEYAQVSSLNEINTILYKKLQDKSKDEIESEYINSVGNYIKVLSLFSNSDINLDTFETGFKMELWRYMLMDTVIHPMQHVLYQYLKNSEYKKIVGVINNTKGIFLKYSTEKTGYKLSEFDIERSEYQAKLKELGQQYAGNEDVIEFIRSNYI